MPQFKLPSIKISSYQNSLINGVVSAIPLRETIVFTSFSVDFQDVAVKTKSILMSL